MEYTCEQCNKVFYCRVSNRNNKHKFCSRDCFFKYSKEHKKKNCDREQLNKLMKFAEIRKKMYVE